MENKLKNIIQMFLDNVCKELGKTQKDINYFDYCRGQKQMLLDMKKVVSQNNTDYLKEFKVLQNKYQNLAQQNSNFYNGGINIVNYIIREYKKAGV